MEVSQSLFPTIWKMPALPLGFAMIQTGVRVIKTSEPCLSSLLVPSPPHLFGLVMQGPAAGSWAPSWNGFFKTLLHGGWQWEWNEPYGFWARDRLFLNGAIKKKKKQIWKCLGGKGNFGGCRKCVGWWEMSPFLCCTPSPAQHVQPGYYLRYDMFSFHST